MNLQMTMSLPHKPFGNWLGSFCLIAVVIFHTGQSFAETVDGFVAKIDSSMEFDVGKLHMVMDGTTQCKTEDLQSNIQLQGKTYAVLLSRNYFVMQSHPDPSHILSAYCNNLPLKIGSHVQIIGDARGASFFATQVTVFDVNIRQNIVRWPVQREWEGGALLEEKPQVGQTAQGWAGTMWLDGYPMSIASDAIVLTAPSGTQMDYKIFGLSSALGFFPALSGTSSAPRMGAIISHSSSSFPAFSANLFEPNTWATYRGGGTAGGFVVLRRIRLWPNQINTREKEYWTQLTPVIHTPDYSSHIAGSMKFANTRGNKSLKIVADRDVQDFASKLGTTLIPQYQKALPETDATKIHFRFYVVRPVGATLDDEINRTEGISLLRPSWDEAVVAFPSGLIVIPDRTLARVDNEAQLASILSCAIASVLQKHSYIARYAHLGSSPNVDALDFDAFALSRTEQALRIGIRQMYLAGYDIREAPFAWTAAEGKAVVNPAVNPKYPSDDVPWYTAYAFDYISQYYSDVDYSKLKKGEAEYAQFLQELRKADPEAFEKK